MTQAVIMPDDIVRDALKHWNTSIVESGNDFNRMKSTLTAIMNDIIGECAKALPERSSEHASQLKQSRRYKRLLRRCSQLNNALIKAKATNPVDVAAVREAGFCEGVEASATLYGVQKDYWREKFNVGLPDLAPLIRALSAEHVQREQWQTIETAPRDWSDILLYVPNLNDDHRKVCEGYYDLEYTEWRSQAFGVLRPTHWMPLPSAPTSEAEA